MLQTLEEVNNQPNTTRSTGANALLALIDWRFIINIFVLEGIFKIIKHLSDLLQSPDLDFGAANILITDLVQQIEEKRCDVELNKMWKEAQEACADLDIVSPIGTSTPGRTHRQPSRLSDFVMDTTAGHRTEILSEEEYRKHVYSEVIDRLVSELKRRFSVNVSDIMKGASALNPKAGDFLEKGSVMPMANHYGISNEDLHAELHQIRRLIIKKKTVACSLQPQWISIPYCNNTVKHFQISLSW